MGQFTATLSYLINDMDIEETRVENPDEATLFSLIRAFVKEKASHIFLYYHDTPDAVQYKVMMIAACYKERFIVWYQNMATDPAWLELRDPAQYKNYREVPFRLTNGLISGVSMCFTVTLERAREAAAYFLKHGTANLEESWKKPVYSGPKKPQK